MHGKTKSLVTYSIFILVLISLFLSACAGSSPDLTTQPVPTNAWHGIDLTPYVITPGTATPQSNLLPTITSFPSPTPTPRTHEVKKGEDMFGISLLYGVTLEELKAANPEVNPNMMSVGTILIIPGSGDTAVIDVTPDIFPTPTAVPFEAGSIYCTLIEDGGAWCSQPVYNTQGFPLEGVSAIFSIVDPQSQDSLLQAAFLPLDILYPEQSLPLSAYFPPPVPDAFQARAEIGSSLPYPDDGRYLPTRIDHQEFTIAENGLSAAVVFDLSLDIPEGSAQRIRVAAIAYDQHGNVIGIRRWEKSGDQLLKAGQALPVSLNIYSNSGPILRIELAAEARP